MRINKKKYLESVAYIKRVNKSPLSKIDFSEFGEKKIKKEIVEEWKFTGLSNKYFIDNYFLDKKSVTVMVGGLLAQNNQAEVGK